MSKTDKNPDSYELIFYRAGTKQKAHRGPCEYLDDVIRNRQQGEGGSERVTRKGFTEKVTFERSPAFGEEQPIVLCEDILGRGKSKGKAPGTGAQLGCLRNGRSRGRGDGDGVRSEGGGRQVRH